MDKYRVRNAKQREKVREFVRMHVPEGVMKKDQEDCDSMDDEQEVPSLPTDAARYFLIHCYVNRNAEACRTGC